MALLNINIDAIDPTPSFTPIPAGIYLAQVVDSDIKKTKTQTGEYISLTLEIIDGDMRGRRVFTNINHVNANQEAERIGQKTLKQLCVAAGLTASPRDTAELHNRPLRIKVVIKKDEQYGDKNEIKGYEAATGVVLPPAAAAPAAAPAKPAPWMTKKAAA